MCLLIIFFTFKDKLAKIKFLKSKSFFFLFLFVGFLLTPTSLLIIDDHIDTSYVFSMTEEENNKDLEHLSSIFEVVLVSVLHEYYGNISLQKDLRGKNFNLNHSKIYFETISPPPELF